MARDKTRVRIWTNRTSKSAWEAIEIDRNGYIHWLGQEDNVHFSFPVCLHWVEELFEKSGRFLDVDRLPSNTVFEPY